MAEARYLRKRKTTPDNVSGRPEFKAPGDAGDNSRPSSYLDPGASYSCLELLNPHKAATSQIDSTSSMAKIDVLVSWISFSPPPRQGASEFAIIVLQMFLAQVACAVFMMLADVVLDKQTGSSPRRRNVLP